MAGNPVIGNYGTRLPFNSFVAMITGFSHRLQQETKIAADIRPFEEEGFVRVAFKTPDSKTKPLVIDIQPGYTTEFGDTVELRSKSGWPAIFGPEIWYGGQEDGPKLRTPMENFEHYIESSFSQPLLLTHGRDPQTVFNVLAQTGHPKVEAAGGLLRYGPVNLEGSQREMASRLTIGVAPKVRQQDAWQGIYNYAQQAGEGDMWQNVVGYAPFQGDDRMLRMRKVGEAAMTGEPGDPQWEITGLGKDAADMLKRRNVVGGLREAAQLFQPTVEGTGVEEMEPEYITGMAPTERQGYRWLNAIMPGETERRAAIVRPGTYFADASPFPGAALTYRDPLKGAYSGGYPTPYRRELPIEDFSRMAEVELKFGVFKEKRIKDEEGEYLRTDYIKQRELEGYVLESGKEAIIGTYQLPGEEEVRPIRYNAKGNRPMFFTGDPDLGLPVGFEKTTGEPTTGMPSMQKTRRETWEEAAARTGREPTKGAYTPEGDPFFDPPLRYGRVPQNVQEYQVQQPGYRRPTSELIQERFTAGGGGQVEYDEPEGAFLSFPMSTLTGISEKTIQKSAGTMAAGVDQLLTDEDLRVYAGGAHNLPDVESRVSSEQANMVMTQMTAESKSPLLQFMYETAAMPPETQAEMFGMLPGKLGRRMQADVMGDILSLHAGGDPEAEGFVERPIAIDYEQMAERYAEFEGERYRPEVTVYEMFDRMRKRANAMPAEASMRMFGRASFEREDAPWTPIGFILPEEKQFYTKMAYEGMALGPKGTGEDALPQQEQDKLFNEMMRFRPVYNVGGEATFDAPSPPRGGGGEPRTIRDMTTVGRRIQKHRQYQDQLETSLRELDLGPEQLEGLGVEGFDIGGLKEPHIGRFTPSVPGVLGSGGRIRLGPGAFARKDLTSTIAHEIGHAVRSSRPEIYDLMTEASEQGMKDEVLDERFLRQNEDWRTSDERDAIYAGEYTAERFAQELMANRSLEYKPAYLEPGAPPASEEEQRALRDVLQSADQIPTTPDPESLDPVGYMWSTRTAGVLGTSASPPTPEHLTKQALLGYEEMAAINMVYPEAAEQMNLRLEQGAAQAGPYPKDWSPRHSRAWREIGNIHRYQSDNTLDVPILPGEKTTLTPELIKGLRTELATEDMDLEELDKFIGGAGPLYNPKTQEMLERPQTIADIAAYRYGDPEMNEPLNFIVKKYGEALGALAGGETRAAGPLAAMRHQRRKVFETSSGRALQEFGGRWLAGSLGGRYSAATGLGLNEAVIRQERMDAMIRQVAEARDIRPTEDRMKVWRQQMEEAGGMPGLIYRSPTISRTAGVLAMNFVTPSMIKQRTGVDIEEASKMSPEGVAVPGSVQATGVVAGFGPRVGSFIGDWDFDLATALGLVDIDPTTKDLVFKGGGEVGRRLAMTPEQIMEEQDQAMRLMLGETAGVPGGELNVFANAFSEMAYGTSPKGTMSSVPAEDIFQAGLARIESRHGMGISYNIRRLFESSASALKIHPEDIAEGHSAQALSYQRYLDYLVDIQGQEGYSNLETMIQTGIFTMNRGGKNEVRMMAMGGAGGEFGDMWRSSHSQTMDFAAQMGNTMAKLVGEDIESGHMLPEAAAFMFQMKGMDPQAMAEQIRENPLGPGAALQKIVEETKDYDFMQTPIGLGFMTSTLGRTAGWLGRGARTIELQSGDEVEVMSEIAQEPFEFMGREVGIGQLRNEPEVALTETYYQSMSRQGGLPGPARTAMVAQELARTKPGYENLPPQVMQWIVGQFGGGADLAAVQEARVAEAANIHLKEGMLPTKPTIRGSQLRHFGSIPGMPNQEYSEASLERYAWQARQRLVGAEVAQLSQATLGRIYPVDPKLTGPAAEFEEMVAQRMTREGYTSMVHGLKPQQSAAMPLMFMGGKADQFEFTGTPDVVAIAPEGHLEVVEAKWTQAMDDPAKTQARAINKLFSPGVQIQPSAYASGLEAAAGVSKDFFIKAVSPWFRDQTEAAAIGGEWYEAIRTKGIQTRVASGLGGDVGAGTQMEEVTTPAGGAFDYRRYAYPSAPGETFPIQESVMGATEFITDLGEVSTAYAALQGAAANQNIPLQSLAGDPATVRRAEQPGPTVRYVGQKETEAVATNKQLLQLMQGFTQSPGMTPAAARTAGAMMAGYFGGAGGAAAGGQVPIATPFAGMGGEGGEPPTFLVEHMFRGQGKHPEEVQRRIDVGLATAKQAMGSEELSNFYQKSQEFLAEQLSITRGQEVKPSDIPAAGMISGFGEVWRSQEGWQATAEFLQEHKAVITPAAKEYGLVMRGAQEAASGQVVVPPQDLGLLTGMMAGADPTGRALMLAQSLREKGQAAGVMAGKPATMLTEDELEKFRTGIAKVEKSMADLGKAVDTSAETITKEEQERMKLIKRELVDISGIPRQRLLDKYREAQAGLDAGTLEMGAAEETAHYGGYAATLGQEVNARVQAGRLRAAEEGWSARTVSQATRRLIGGFGLFYMGTLAKLGLGQFQQGYAEYEQYQEGMEQAGVREFGAGQYDPRVSPEMLQRRAQLRSGGGVFAAMRRAGAPLAGTAVSDIGGAVLTGFGAYGLGMHVAGSMMAVEGLKAAGTTLGRVVAPAVGLAVAGAALIGTQAAYAMNREDTIMQSAATRGGGGWWDDAWADYKLLSSEAIDTYQRTPYQETALFQSEELTRQVGQMREGEWPLSYTGMIIPGAMTAEEQLADRYSMARITGRDTSPPMKPFEAVPLGTLVPGALDPDWTGDLTPEEKVKLASTLAMTEIPELAHLPPEITGRLALGILGNQDRSEMTEMAEKMREGGATEEDVAAWTTKELEKRGASMDVISDVGAAMVAGAPVMEMSQAVRALTGRRPVDEGYFLTEEGIAQQISWLGAESPAVQAGLALMGEIPGITGQLRDATDEEVLALAGGIYGDIAEGPNVGRYLQREAVAGERRRYGLETRVDPYRYDRERRMGPATKYAETQQNMMYSRGLGIQQTQMAGGIPSWEATPITEWAEGSVERMAFAERAFAQEPITMTQLSMEGGLDAMFASMDIRGGVQTGLPWGTTGMQRGDVSAQAMAAQVWGADYAQDEGLQAATEGLGTTFEGTEVPEYMQGMGGMRALQWQAKTISREARKASTGNQLAMLELQGRYQPQFWAIEDKQRGLQHRQAMWGFEMQEQQFAMQGTQFYENRGIQAQQMQMGREWAREDWSTQDQMRAMQWGWKQEDFQEDVRFMTGRQRQKAERGMERATIMYGMEGDQLDTQRKRQEETWALEDQRFELVKKHFEEQRELQKESMDKQKEFYLEGKKLSDQQVELQREYWKEMHALQLAAAGAAASYADQMDEVNDKMEILAKSQQDQAGLAKVAQTDSVKMINAIRDGLNHITTHASAALKSILAEEQKLIPEWKLKEDKEKEENAPGDYEYQQAGGDIFPGHNYVVGERGPELLRLGTIGSVVNQADLLDSGGYRSRWNDTMSLTTHGKDGGGPQVINLYVGNELLKRFVLSTVKDDLKVA